MKKRLSFLFLLLAFFSAIPMTQVLEEPEVEYEMTTYHVGLIFRGPKWTPEVTPETKRLQEGHMAHIGEMVASGDLVLAGPFIDDGELRGMFVFRVDSMEAAKALTEADPAVKAGRLIVEIHPWYSARGITIDQALDDR